MISLDDLPSAPGSADSAAIRDSGQLVAPTSDMGDFWDVMVQRVLVVTRAWPPWRDRKLAAADSVLSFQRGNDRSAFEDPVYRPRCPERTVPYRAFALHFEHFVRFWQVLLNHRAVH